MADVKLISTLRLTGQHVVAHADPFIVFTDPQNDSDVVVATIARMDRLDRPVHTLPLAAGAELRAFSATGDRVAYSVGEQLFLIDTKSPARLVSESCSEHQVAFFGAAQRLAWITPEHELCAEGFEPVPLADEHASSVHGHPNQDVLLVETYVPQDSITIHRFRVDAGALVGEVWDEGDPAYGLDVVGFDGHAHNFVIDDHELYRARTGHGDTPALSWEVEDYAALRGSCSSDHVLLYDGDSDAPHMKIRKSDYSDEPIELTLPIAPGESFRRGRAPHVCSGLVGRCPFLWRTAIYGHRVHLARRSHT
jgi:hypothetical protein